MLPQQLVPLNNGFINYKIVDGKKTMTGNAFKHKSMNWIREQADDDLEMMKYSGTKAIGPCEIIRIEGSGITCLDFDEDVPLDRVFELYPFLEGHCYTKGNTKGYHFYVLSNFTKKKQDCFEMLKGDLLVEQVFELEGKDWFNPIQELDTELIQSMLKDETDTESVSTCESEIKLEKLTYYHKCILDNIHPNEYSSYEQWTKFIWAIKFTFDDAVTIADTYSKFSKGYVSKEDVKKHMDSAMTPNIGWGYLMNLSKKSNFTNHKLIISENRPLPKNEDDLVEIALSLTSDIIKVDDELYVYEQPYWILDKTKKQTKVAKKMMDILKPSFKEYLKRTKAFQSPDENEMTMKASKIKLLEGILIEIGKISMLNNIVNMCNIQLDNSEIEFDAKPYLFCFKNCAFDLQTSKKVVIKKDDYITQHTSYDYVPSTQQQKSLVQSLLHKILTNDDVYKCYTSVLFAGMTGVRVEKFFLANGCGRNGKGLINELFTLMLGPYAYILPVDILTSKSGLGTGANPQVVNCHKKRFILAREPEEGDKLRTSIIKELTGCGEFNARDLFKSKCSIKMTQVMMLECNAKPQLSGTMNSAILERIVDIPFDSRFTDEPSEVNEEEHIYPIDKTYKFESWQLEHRCALFDILIDADKDIYIPKIISSKSKEYVMSSDDIYNWIIENFETGTNDDIITIKDLYADYCQSETFMTMTKEEKRIMNKRKFSLMLKSSIAFHGKYKDDKKTINGKTYNERLHGYKMKVEEPSIDI